jgi:hypothetical protein
MAAVSPSFVWSLLFVRVESVGEEMCVVARLGIDARAKCAWRGLAGNLALSLADGC